MIKATLIEFMGSDHTITNSARVSFAKHEYPEYNDETNEYELSQRDEKLINYLAKHRHTSPFGHNFATFHVSAPIFVARQLVKHKFLRWNEISRRYVNDPPEFYTPKLRKAAENKKQGSGGEMADHICDEVIRHAGIEAAKQYTYLLKMGVCEEQARMVLPQNTMTEWYWSGSMDAFADMCNLRCKGDTQLETQIVANQISNSLSTVWPVGWDSLRGTI